jgi:hypothetical protein
MDEVDRMRDLDVDPFAVTQGLRRIGIMDPSGARITAGSGKSASEQGSHG